MKFSPSILGVKSPYFWFNTHVSPIKNGDFPAMLVNSGDQPLITKEIDRRSNSAPNKSQKPPGRSGLQMQAFGPAVPWRDQFFREEEWGLGEP